MSRYEKLLNMLMDFDSSIEFAAISNTTGDILWNSARSGLKLKKLTNVLSLYNFYIKMMFSISC